MIKQKGFTLTEVLIALVVVAIGVIGHAKMQSKSMQIAQQSLFAQTANIALSDLAQRIRSNPELANSFVFSNLENGNDVTSIKNCSSDSCSKSEFVNSELAEWFAHLKNQMPSPRFSVSVKSTDANIYNLLIIWDAAKKGVGSATCDTTKADSYQCGSMSVWIP